MFRFGSCAFLVVLFGLSFIVITSPNTAFSQTSGNAGGSAGGSAADSPGGQTVLLDFTLPGCAPCRQIAPLMKELSTQGYPVREVDGATQQELVRHFQVTQFPTFIMVAGGTVVDRVVGGGDPVIMKPRILKMFEQAQKHLVARQEQVNPTELKNRENQAVSAASPVSAGNSEFDSPAGPSPMRPLQPVVASPIQANEASEDHPTRVPVRHPVRHSSPPCASSVRLRVDYQGGHSWGTGTIIDAQGGQALILTCGHIFRESKGEGNIEVNLFGNGSEYTVSGKCLHYDLETDLGLVVIAPLCPVQVSPIIRDESQLPVGTTVMSVGCDRGATPSVREHTIKSFDRIGTPRTNAYPFHYIQVSGAPVGGRSGGGLFTKDGSLLGVCNTADPEPDEGHFVPPHVIRRMLDERNLANVYRSPSLSDPTRPSPAIGASVGEQHGIALAENTASLSPTAVPTAFSSSNTPTGTPIAGHPHSSERADRFDHLPVRLPNAGLATGAADGNGTAGIPDQHSLAAATPERNASRAIPINETHPGLTAASSAPGFATTGTAVSVGIPHAAPGQANPSTTRAAEQERAVIANADEKKPEKVMGALERTLIENRLVMSEMEQATLDEITRRRQDGDDVILIVHSRRDPKSSPDVIRLENVSEQFLNELAKTPMAASSPADPSAAPSPIPVAFPIAHGTNGGFEIPGRR